MLNKFLTLLATSFCLSSAAQNAAGVLTVEKIMSDPRWMGSSPSEVSWGMDGKTVYFNWNPTNDISDSVYKITVKNQSPQKASPREKNEYVADNNVVYNQKRNAAAWIKNADVFYRNAGGSVVRITNTTDVESGATFSFNDTKIVYTRNFNLFAWDIATGSTEQLTNFRMDAARKDARLSQQEQWLKNDQLAYMKVLQERKQKSEAAEKYDKENAAPKLKPVYTEGRPPVYLSISPNGQYVTYSIYVPGAGKRTIVPEYVTESGFTNSMDGRTKVGSQQGTATFYLYDLVRDTVFRLKTDSIPGIRDIPVYVNDYPKALQKMKKDSALREVSLYGLVWSPSGKYALADLHSNDNKDRWIMLLNPATRSFQLVDRQHDDAWIGGPGIYRSLGWIDAETVWFQSEATGYSHLYSYHIPTQKRVAITRGHYEVQQARLSNDKKSFYITTNEAHPGEKQFYKLTISSGAMQKLSTMPGANEVELSPDEKYLAIRHSYINKPWELYLQENKPGAKAIQVTDKAQSEAFKKYQWRVPEVITFNAADGAPVYARVYKPTTPHPDKPAVLFVHGAGYLQNAHKWWSSYFREYMFNNLLADNGYYVMDIDYRGSAGYGRDWRTGIYRYMGGKDLSDHADAVRFMVAQYGVNPANVGLYGGSYGGFITLMGLFTKPDVFKSGAALRPVTDWANYNHGYTSNILNEPFTDSIAYKRSSPIYFADGLKGHLLICHGMVDVNVHYQDVVKLTQRLIELGKDNWELASYPLEDHGFVEPSSWTDEYKRIFKLFETTLKKQTP